MRAHQFLTGLVLALVLAAATAAPAVANPPPAPTVWYGLYQVVFVPVPVMPVVPETAPARVTITAPADAVLMFNGVTVKGEGETRAFATAPLYKGYPYAYEVTAVVFRGRQMLTATERVVVWGGQESKLTFNLPPAPTKLEQPKKVGN